MIVWLNRALTVAIDALSDAKRAEGFDGVTNDILEYLLLARSHVGESQVKEQTYNRSSAGIANNK